MNISVKPYSWSDKIAWDRFVMKSNNGTLFHRLQFLDYHPRSRFRNHHLVFKDTEHIIALFPSVSEERDGKKTLVSHPGASFGGFVFPINLGINEVDVLVRSLHAYALKKGFHRIEMTLPPIIYLQQPNNYLDFCLFRHGFQYKKREVSSIITLNYAPQRILSTFKSETRTAIRKAGRSGVVVKASSDFETFYSILKTNLKLRHNVTPTHTLGELKQLKNLLASDIRLFGAFLNNQMIAGLTLFVCNPRVILAFYISHLKEYQTYRPVNLLMFEVIKWALERKFKFFDLGIFTVNMEPNWGLGRFKENFGAHGIFRDTLYLDF
ncbi:MAG: GNAT family N-acetyltransferase [Gemmatimonadota bacterium]|nr:MAG: GNAT family N-acetyltransferase [Gemmatimonadota bacterium]